MQILNTEAAFADALDSMADDDPVKAILQLRANELVGDGYVVSDLARFVIIEPGDALSTIEARLNVPIVTNPIDGSRYGDPDFTPCWEWIIDHGRCWEMPFIMTDEGFGHVLIVPDKEGIDQILHTLCRENADKAEGSEAS